MHRPIKNQNSANFLGVECGGTHTTAMLVDQGGKIIRERCFGPANIKLVTDQQLRGLFRKIHALFPNPAGLAVGMAGARTKTDFQRIESSASKLWKSIGISATNDLETALLADAITFRAVPVRHSSSKTKILVLSGTGSCCFGKSSSGRTEKIGGWGHLLGDRGSGYDIGLEGLKSVFSRYDLTGKWPTLGERFLQSLLMNNPEQLVTWSVNATKAEVAALASQVFAAARKRDRVALTLINLKAEDLALAAICCAKRLAKKDTSVDFLLAGGILLNNPIFARRVKKRIRFLWPESSIRTLKNQGAWGAAKLAHDRFINHSIRPATSQAKNPSTPTSPPPSDSPLSLQASPTEMRHPKSMDLDQMPISEALSLMLSEEKEIKRGLERELPKVEKAIRRISQSFKAGGRLFYVGAGTSGRLGVLDASECPPTFQTNPEMVQGIIAGGPTALANAVEGAEDDIQAGAQAVSFRGITSKDVVVGIAASGRTPFVWGALAEASRKKAFTILITFNPNLVPRYQIRPNIQITPEIGPEILTGSTRLKAGTATKLILNMLSTLSMVQIGKTISNLMVDLNPSNDKLRDRAIRIVSTLSGENYETSRQALNKTGWDVKKARRVLKKPTRER